MHGALDAHAHAFLCEEATFCGAKIVCMRIAEERDVTSEVTHLFLHWFVGRSSTEADAANGKQARSMATHFTSDDVNIMVYRYLQESGECTHTHTCENGTGFAREMRERHRRGKETFEASRITHNQTETRSCKRQERATTAQGRVSMDMGRLNTQQQLLARIEFPVQCKVDTLPCTFEKRFERRGHAQHGDIVRCMRRVVFHQTKIRHHIFVTSISFCGAHTCFKTSKKTQKKHSRETGLTTMATASARNTSTWRDMHEVKILARDQVFSFDFCTQHAARAKICDSAGGLGARQLDRTRVRAPETRPRRSAMGKGSLCFLLHDCVGVEAC